MRCDVAVVGGGPIGCTAARLLARRGYHTVILEEHDSIGEPVRCAGLVTPRVLDLAGVHHDVIQQKITGAAVHTPGGETVHIGGDRTHAVAVHRRSFDRDIAEQAVAAGAELRCSWKVTGIHGVDGGFVVTGNGELRCSHVIGADGVRSSVAAMLGFPQPPEYVQALQTVNPAGDAPGEVDVWVGNDVAPGFFAWRIPAGDTTRVGLGVSAGQGIMHYFQRLLRRLDVEPHEVQAGLIPMEMSRRFCTGRAALLGDAAGQVKATSGGGLYPGLVAARCLADALEEGTTDYRRRFMRSYGRELKRSVWLRQRFKGLSDGDMDRLLGMVDADIAATVTAHGDLDYPSRAVKKVVGRHPSLLRFLLPF